MGLRIFFTRKFSPSHLHMGYANIRTQTSKSMHRKNLLNYTHRDILKFINLLTAVEKIKVWAQNVSTLLNFKNLRFKRFNFVLNCSLMLTSLTELEHLKNLLNKTPFFKKRRRESRKEKRR